jgi:peptidoglycan/LPS O-acetylase OafA/YrhL
MRFVVWLGGMSKIEREENEKKRAVSLDSYFQNLPNCLNFARAFLALVVCISHIGWIFGKDNYQIRSLGVYSVAVFFGLSGFLIYQSSITSRGVIKFGLKRVRRIFPAFVLVLASTSLLYYPLYLYISTGSLVSIRRSEQLAYFFENLSLSIIKPEISDSLAFSGTAVWNPSLWTLKFEFLLYFVCYLLSRVLKNLSRIVVPSLTILCAITASTLQNSGLFFEFTYLAQFFLLGMSIWLYREKFSSSTYTITTMFAGFAFSYFVIEEFFVTASFLTLMTLTFCLRVRIHYFKKIDYSYGIYLHAGPITHLAVLITIKAQLPIWITYGLSVTVTIVAAGLSWHLVESRFTNRAAERKSV